MNLSVYERWLTICGAEVVLQLPYDVNEEWRHEGRSSHERRGFDTLKIALFNLGIFTATKSMVLLQHLTSFSMVDTSFFDERIIIASVLLEFPFAKLLCSICVTISFNNQDGDLESLFHRLHLFRAFWSCIFHITLTPSAMSHQFRTTKLLLHVYWSTRDSDL